GCGAPRLWRAKVAVVMSNYVNGPRAGMIEDACHAAGLQLDRIGAPTTPTGTPEVALARADLVIGYGRCALEAMAAGRATYIYGVSGGNRLVPADLYPEMDGHACSSTPARDRRIDQP